MDWGGVLTTNVFDSFAAFCEAEGLGIDSVRDAFKPARALGIHTILHTDTPKTIAELHAVLGGESSA
jgi:imidazolonepropionase-like amidohydrolase